MIGTVVIAGYSYRITQIELREGMLHITAHGDGPSPEIRDEPVTVFGADGQGVGQGWRITIPQLRRRQNVTIHLPLRLDSIDTLSGETTVILQ